MTENKLNTAPLPPQGTVDAVLDTDTFNEIDDQFALALFLRCPEYIHPVAIYAAPFLNSRSTSPGDGMNKSYDEIMRVLERADRMDMAPLVFRGSEAFLPSETQPVISEAARDLAQRAMSYTAEQPLYVVAIGAITNVASALLLEPQIKDKIVVVWLGGHAHHFHDTAEFNMMQDIASARVVFGSGVPLVQLPCMGVVSAFTLSGAEMEKWLLGKGKLADYLARTAIAEAESYAAGKPWSRVIWDVTAVAWLIDRDRRLLLSYDTPRPMPNYERKYDFDDLRAPESYVYYIRRDWLMTELIDRITD